jgi:hypothetical protein
LTVAVRVTVPRDVTVLIGLGLRVAADENAACGRALSRAVTAELFVALALDSAEGRFDASSRTAIDGSALVARDTCARAKLRASVAGVTWVAAPDSAWGTEATTAIEAGVCELPAEMPAWARAVTRLTVLGCAAPWLCIAA